MPQGDNEKPQVMALNERLGVTVEQLEDAGVFNTLLGIDTQLFIDPKLINTTNIPEFQDVTDDIHAYVRRLIQINAQAHKAERLFDIAMGMIAIKEPAGLSIGYGNSRDSGTSIPKSVAANSLRSLTEMISVGIDSLEVMELLGLFISRFGADSISDLTAHIIYPRLCAFTERITKELNVNETKKFTHDNTEYELPFNPLTGKQLIFVPTEMLSELPLATSWEDIADAAQQNAEHRAAFNAIVGEDIKAYAKKVKKDPSAATHSASTMRTIIEVYDNAVVEPYDTFKDPAGYARVNNQAAELGKHYDSPLVEILSPEDMVKFVNDEVIAQFERNIVKLGANTLLYQRQGNGVDYTKPVKEDAAQILFHIAADYICRQSNILVNREPQIGNGAVDFNIGQGYSNKVVVEIKKSNNKSLVDGYKNQVMEYIDREDAAAAFYVVLIVSEKNVSNKGSQLNQLQRLHAKRISDGEKVPNLIIINALEQTPPSKIKG